MSDEEINEFFYTFRNHFASHTFQRESTWEEIIARQAQASMSQQVYNFGVVNSFNNEGYFSQHHSYMLSYNHSSWGTHDNLSYGHPIMQSQGSSSSNYQDQF